MKKAAIMFSSALLALLCGVIQAHAAITLDASSTSGVGSQTTNNIQLTASQGNETLVTSFAYSNAACAPTFTVNGVAPTLAASSSVSGRQVVMYYTAGISAGNVSVTSTCSTGRAISSRRD